MSTEGAAIEYVSRSRVGEAAHGARVDRPAPRDRGVAVALHDQVVGDRQVRRRADAGPVLRDVGDVLADRLARACWLPTSHAVDRDRPGRAAAEAGEDLGQLGLAVAGDARDAEDLAGPDVERDAAQGGQAAVALRPRRRARPGRPGPGSNGDSLDRLEDLAADHQAGQVGRRRAGRRRRRPR